MENSAPDSRHVIIADDDDDDFYIFSVAVEELSITIVLSRAKDGNILIRLLDDKIPDILFLDIMLPGKDGRQCLKEIRANHRYDGLPVVMYTSMKDMREIEFCYREGANLYVMKPTGYSDLKTILERILSIDWKKMMYYPPLSQFVVNGFLSSPDQGLPAQG
jgi:CheY-like chemotaxis protein